MFAQSRMSNSAVDSLGLTPGVAGGGGGGSARPIIPFPDPVSDKNPSILVSLFKIFNLKPYTVADICQEKIPCLRQSDNIDILFKTKSPRAIP